jgi:hypothetical protein
MNLKWNVFLLFKQANTFMLSTGLEKNDTNTWDA